MKLNFDFTVSCQNKKCSEQSLLNAIYPTNCCASNMTSDKSELFDFDIGSIYLSADKISDSQTYNSIKNVWKPDSKFTFLSHSGFGNKYRSMLNWLPKVPWVAYSKKVDGAFCLSCAL